MENNLQTTFVAIESHLEDLWHLHNGALQEY